MATTVAGASHADEIVTLRLFNVDDHMSALLTNADVTDQLILQAGFQQDTGFVDITDFLALGLNSITITDTNLDDVWAYGYDLRIDGITVDYASCGVAGVSGCQDGDRTTGLVYSHDPDVPNGVVAIPEPASWALLILGLGAAGAAVRRSRRRTLRAAA